jgi:hypothetical protein
MDASKSGLEGKHYIVITNMILTSLVVIGIISSLTFSKPTIITTTETKTITSTSTYKECIYYARLVRVFSIAMSGINELIYFGSNSLLTKALNIVMVYIDEARYGNKTTPKDYIDALIAIQTMINAFNSGDYATAYEQYSIAGANIDYLGIVSGCT